MERLTYVMLDGFATAKKCSMEGRALMQMDAQQLSSALYKIIPSVKYDTAPCFFLLSKIPIYEECRMWLGYVVRCGSTISLDHG